MDEVRQDQDDSAHPAGVFGNLPTARPGTRSPRRKPLDRGGEDAGEAAPPDDRLDPVADAAAVAAATAPRRARESESEDEGDAADETGELRQRAGLEDIAWAGVAAAADAATIGVRLAGRALERLRDGVDPR